MKTAISIPDTIFEQAEELAQKQGLSRSELYTKAICLYLKANSATVITAKLNQVYSQQDSSLDKVIAELQSNSLGAEEW